METVSNILHFSQNFKFTTTATLHLFCHSRLLFHFPTKMLDILQHACYSHKRKNYLLSHKTFEFLDGYSCRRKICLPLVEHLECNNISRHAPTCKLRETGTFWGALPTAPHHTEGSHYSWHHYLSFASLA